MTSFLLSDQDGLKRAAAIRAVGEVVDGMVVGLGSGSTAAFAIEALAARVAGGLRILGIPTSHAAATLARRRGLRLTSFAEHLRIDVTIDGADQVTGDGRYLVKGLGGALLREKIVASASEEMIVVVDETKVVDRLGGKTPLPVEIASFGWETVFDRLSAIGCAPRLRLSAGKPYMTDGGNYIVDCTITDMTDPVALEAQLSAMVGVVENGIFLDFATKIVIGRPAGVEVIDRCEGRGHRCEGRGR